MHRRRSSGGSARTFIDLIGEDRRGRWILVVVLGLVVSVVEMFAALLVYVVLGSATNADEPADFPLVGGVMGAFPAPEQGRAYLVALTLIATFFFVRAAVFIFQVYVQNRVALNAGVRLSVKLLDGYLRLPYSFHIQRNSADLIRNAYASVGEVISSVFKPAVGFVSETLLVIGVIAATMLAAPKASLLVIATFAPIILIMIRLIRPRMERLGSEAQAATAVSFQALQESLQGIRDIKLLGRAGFFLSRFASSRAVLARGYYLRSVLAEVPRVTVETLLILFILLFLGIVTATTEDPQESFAVLGLFGYAGLRVLPSMNRLVANVNSMRYGAAAVTSLYDDLAMIRGLAEEHSSETAPLTFSNEVRLDNLSFRFPGTEVDVLREIELTISAGSSIGIVGPTGSGKSTLVDVLVGLLVPTSGRVTVDGHDVRHDQRAWQANIGMVPQNVFLFDDTLARNIAFGLRDEEIDREALEMASHVAQLDEVVEGLPLGFETIVGERGIRLSGGQRQRVAIARALYRRPRVLVLDEGTSALDNLTEARLMQEIESFGDIEALIAIAHRLSTVRNCDQVVLLEQGRVADAGTFDELFERNDAFRQLATNK